MIRELKLSNFRLFDKEVKVRFRPITILIGENNAGKSSVIKFLMMLKQSLNTREAGFLVTDGTGLGSFGELKNKKSRSRRLIFSLKVNEDSSPKDRILAYLRQREELKEKKPIGYAAQAIVGYNRKNQFLTKEQKAALLINDETILEKTERISPNSVFLEFKDKAYPTAQDYVIDDCASRLQFNVQSLYHLSAMREELQGEFRAESRSPQYVGKRGENTILALWKSRLLEQKKHRNFLLKHTIQTLAIDDIKFKEGKYLVFCEARNAHSKKTINAADLGFGVNQCLPIFVQGLLMPPRSQLLVEQPEAQVHPTAQIEMGSFFVELWKQYQVGSVIETHSDNLLLRIRNHVARGVVSTNEVSIAFFTLDDQGEPTVKNLDVYDDGTIQEGLPMEFFGKNLTEALKMHVRPDESIDS